MSAAPVKVYGPAISTCTARVLATLEEKGVEYELVSVNLMTGEHKQPDHLSRNPFGKAPAFEDGDLVLFESRAISRYIARKFSDQGTDLLRSNNVNEEAIVDVWVDVESQTFYPAISPIVYQCLVAPVIGLPVDMKLVETSVATLEKVLDVYEARLGKTEYLAGDFFSLADLHHVPYTYYLMRTEYKWLIEKRGNVKAWWERVVARPAVERATAGLLLGN